MSKYMVVGFDFEEQRTFAKFFDKLADAENYRMDGAVSLGYVMKVYELTEIVDEDTGIIVCRSYELLYE